MSDSSRRLARPRMLFLMAVERLTSRCRRLDLCNTHGIRLVAPAAADARRGNRLSLRVAVVRCEWVTKVQNSFCSAKNMSAPREHGTIIRARHLVFNFTQIAVLADATGQGTGIQLVHMGCS